VKAFFLLFSDKIISKHIEVAFINWIQAIKDNFIHIILLIAFHFNVIGQSIVPWFDSNYKNIFAEALRSSLMAGVKYDMWINKGRMDGIGFRAGIGV
jgi:hypothetical protein